MYNDYSNWMVHASIILSNALTRLLTSADWVLLHLLSYFTYAWDNWFLKQNRPFSKLELKADSPFWVREVTGSYGQQVLLEPLGLDFWHQ